MGVFHKDCRHGIDGENQACGAQYMHQMPLKVGEGKGLHITVPKIQQIVHIFGFRILSTGPQFRASPPHRMEEEHV